MVIRFGPAGLGPVKEAVENLVEYSRLGFSACEIAFTYGVYIKKKEDALLIGKKAKELGIKLSIHAPYWVNLNSLEKAKVAATKQRILECCKIGDILGAECIVFHPGYYMKMDKEDTYNNICDGIIDLMSTVKKNGWKVKLCPEVMGKVNVFGSLDEISRLVDDTGCSFCIDFAHILARYKKVDYDLVNKKFGKNKKWHCHFSGIEYGDKGERKHIKTPLGKWKELLSGLPNKGKGKSNDITIINESPDMIEDSKAGLRVFKGMK
ncbi:TIM barrel protein [Candidatus Pacearchaeota archaeon]|nr:TIM barrel protein [Candidatus Pacearchaeota archaeon]